MIKHSSPKILIIVERSTMPYYQGTQMWLGPLYILSYLGENGIDGDFLDRNAEPTKNVDYIPYDIIGFSANVNNIRMSLATARQIKRIKPDVKIVFGGPFASSYPQLLMEESCIDAAVVGEGEETFYEYVTRKERKDILGLYTRENGTVKFNGNRPWIKDLDSLPFPSLPKLKIQNYTSIFSKAAPLSYIITTRGCPYLCTFCFHNMGKKWRARSPENVVDEIEWQVNALGIKEIGIVDDNFTLNRGRVIDICDEIIRRKIKVKLQFSNGVRADCVDDEMMERLSEAGLWVINFAPESGSAQTVGRLKKGLKGDDIKKAIGIAKKYGVATELFLMVGFPWETREDYKQTLALPYELDVDFISLHRYIPFPGTQLQPGELTQDDKENLFSDRLYNNYGYDQSDEASKMMRAFYRGWYGNPRRIMRILKILNLYSPNKLLETNMIKNIFANSWMKFRP